MNDALIITLILGPAVADFAWKQWQIGNRYDRETEQMRQRTQQVIGE